MSDPTLPGTPGTGPTPEPEAEGFREAQIEAEKQRQAQVAQDQVEASKAAKEFYSGKPEEPPVVPVPDPEGRKSTSHSTSHSGSKGSSSKS